MNREIKFRGQRPCRTEWEYFSLNEYFEKDDTPTFLEYKMKNIGQFIGLKDKNGVDIYEGDIVEAWSSGSKGTFIIKWRNEGSPCWLLYPNFQNRKHWSISATEYKKGKQFITVNGEVTTPVKEGFYDVGLLVIGNIYENPELLNNSQIR